MRPNSYILAGRMCGAASAVMQTLYLTVPRKREMSQKAIFQSVYVPALTYGHELWVVRKNYITDTSSRNVFPV